MRRAWLARTVAVVALAAFLPLASGGCFGKFQATRNIYAWNKHVDPDPWIVWLVFLGMNLIPVYGGAVLLDAVIFNSVEFWRGANPIREPRTALAPSGESVATTLLDDGRIQACFAQPDGVSRCLYLERETGAVSARDEEGRLLGRVSALGLELAYSGT